MKVHMNLSTSFSALREGRSDPESWAVVTRHLEAPLRASISRVCPPSLVDDALQDALIAVRKSAHSFVAPAGPEPAIDAAIYVWARTIAFRCAINNIRNQTAIKRRERKAQDHYHRLSSVDSPDKDLLDEEARALVHKVLTALPQRYQKVVYLRYFEELSVAEIARLVNRPEGTVSSWLTRATRKLDRSLKHHFPEWSRPSSAAFLLALLPAGLQAQAHIPNDAQQNVVSSLSGGNISPLSWLKTELLHLGLSRAVLGAIVVASTCVVFATNNPQAEDVPTVRTIDSEDNAQSMSVPSITPEALDSEDLVRDVIPQDSPDMSPSREERFLGDSAREFLFRLQRAQLKNGIDNYRLVSPLRIRDFMSREKYDALPCSLLGQGFADFSSRVDQANHDMVVAEFADFYNLDWEVVGKQMIFWPQEKSPPYLEIKQKRSLNPALYIPTTNKSEIILNNKWQQHQAKKGDQVKAFRKADSHLFMAFLDPVPDVAKTIQLTEIAPEHIMVTAQILAELGREDEAQAVWQEFTWSQVPKIARKAVAVRSLVPMAALGLPPQEADVASIISELFTFDPLRVQLMYPALFNRNKHDVNRNIQRKRLVAGEDLRVLRLGLQEVFHRAAWLVERLDQMAAQNPSSPMARFIAAEAVRSRTLLPRWLAAVTASGTVLPQDSAIAISALYMNPQLLDTHLDAVFARIVQHTNDDSVSLIWEIQDVIPARQALIEALADLLFDSSEDAAGEPATVKSLSTIAGSQLYGGVSWLVLARSRSPLAHAALQNQWLQASGPADMSALFPAMVAARCKQTRAMALGALQSEPQLIAVVAESPYPLIPAGIAPTYLEQTSAERLAWARDIIASWPETLHYPMDLFLTIIEDEKLTMEQRVSWLRDAVIKPDDRMLVLGKQLAEQASHPYFTAYGFYLAAHGRGDQETGDKRNFYTSDLTLEAINSPHPLVRAWGVIAAGRYNDQPFWFGLRKKRLMRGLSDNDVAVRYASLALVGERLASTWFFDERQLDGSVKRIILPPEKRRSFPWLQAARATETDQGLQNVMDNMLSAREATDIDIDLLNNSSLLPIRLIENSDELSTGRKISIQFEPPPWPVPSSALAPDGNS